MSFFRIVWDDPVALRGKMAIPTVHLFFTVLSTSSAYARTQMFLVR